MASIQTTIPFKCQKPRRILNNSTKQNENYLSAKSIMGCRRSPRKKLGLGPELQEAELMTNEAVLDAIFKLSPHSPIKRYSESGKQSLLTILSSKSPQKCLSLTSPTRSILSPIRALSLNSPPPRETSSAEDKADKKRASIIQRKLTREQETPTKPRGFGKKKLNLHGNFDETSIKVKSPEIIKRVTRSAKKKPPKQHLTAELYDDYKENEDPNAGKDLTPSPTKKCRVVLSEGLVENLRTPKAKRNVLKNFNTEVKKTKSFDQKSVAFNLDVKTDLATPSVKRNILLPSKSISSLKIDKEEPEINRSKRYLKLCKQNCEIYRKTKRAFHTSAPKQLIGREKEIASISKHISTAIKKNSSGSLYISGAPGTGKSACLNKILLGQKLTRSSLIININCMSCKNTVGIYSKVAVELGAMKTDCRNSRMARKYCEYALTSEGPTVILLLDEMDQLDSKNQEILYTMFEWPSLDDSRVMLIGIANSLDLTDRILPRLQLKVECKPTLIHFKPYSKDQIVKIIEGRIAMANEECSSDTCVIDKAAVQFCARKVAAVAGDARKALDICRRAVEIVEGNTASQTILSPVTDAVPLKVGLPQIASVLNSVYEQTISSKGELVGGFPLQQKLAICTLILLTRSLKCKVVTLGKFHESYILICKKRQVTGVGQSEFLSMLQLIESRGIVSIKSSKQIRLTKVNMALQEKDVEYALQDKTMLTDILNHELLR